MPKLDKKSQDLSAMLEKLVAYESKPAKPKRGGKRVGSGAPKKEVTLKAKSIRLTDQQWDQFTTSGGVKWLREYLTSQIINTNN